MRADTKASRFTPFQLVVGGALLAILLALLDRAVQHTQDAVARARCANDLEQIALFLQSYQDTALDSPTGALPNIRGPGAVGLPPEGPPAGCNLLQPETTRFSGGR